MHWSLLEPMSLISDAWIVLALYWAVSALRVKPMKYLAPMPVRLIQFAFVIPGFYLLFNRQLPWALLRMTVLPKSDVFTVLGVAINFIGVALAIWARYVLGSNWSSQVAIREDHELIQRGPYRLIRHPIYTGIAAGALGTAIVMDHLGSFFGVLLITLGFAYKGKQEELRLREVFGESFDAHIRRTGMFLPKMR